MFTELKRTFATKQAEVRIDQPSVKLQKLLTCQHSRNTQTFFVFFQNVYARMDTAASDAITARSASSTTPNASRATAQPLERVKPFAITPENVLVFKTLPASDAISA